MAIDARIPLGIQPLRLESPMDTAGQAMQIQALQQRAQLGAMKMAEARRVAQEREAVRGIFQQTGGDLAKTAEALQAQGFIEPALQLRKSLAEQAKALQEKRAADQEFQLKRFDLQRNIYTLGVNDPSDQGVARTAQMLVENGFPEEVAKGFYAEMIGITDPSQRRQRFLGYVRKPEDIVAAHAPKIERIDDGQTITFGNVNPLAGPTVGPVQRQMTPGEQQSAKDAAAGRAVSMRGQDLSRLTAQERLQWEQQNPSMTPVETADGVFQVPNRGGPARPVLGPDGKPLAGKPPTEGQSNAAIFANRAVEADRVLTDIGARGAVGPLQTTTVPGQIKSAAESIPLVGDALGAAVNVAPTWLGGPNAAQQQVEQAQRDFINAVLRKESGAVIAESEFANARRQYFPQVGDSPEVIAQKAAARRAAIAGLSQAAGPALPRVQARQQEITPPPAVAPVTAPPAAPRETVPAQPNTPQRVSGRIGGPPQGAGVAPSWDRMPMPREVPEGGKIRDEETGLIYQRRGNAWVPVQ